MIAWEGLESPQVQFEFFSDVPLRGNPGFGALPIADDCAV
jgi:hypothetical protein